MPLFQKSVINSIKQDESLIASRWNNFQNYLTKTDFIKTVKEEKYQDGFLKDIFESCLGYTLDSTNPSAFNLEREKKNETDGKKADGVIYVNGEIIGIVELKDQKTKNLDAVESQAFNYHASHSNSKYIIISNFNELRFYIDKKTAYEKFNLFTITYDEFKKLHLLMSFESLKEDVPLKLKEKSASFEQTISKELYKDFSQFRTHLFENIVKNNYSPVRGEPVEPQHPTTGSGRTELDKQTLLRLTQKLCDRIIFILFAEDRNLLKANTVKEIRSHHAADGFGDRSMYDYYKLYFNAINTGNDKLGIPKYNGGLFATDEMLDSLKIDDSYLDMEAQKLSDFDFESDISVNILGHIFEQSLTDLEELNASIENTEFDKKKSKRKKDGVFYTPEYITRYIVENTLGKLCHDKKEELKIEHETVVVNPRKLTKAEQNYKEILLNYREWLTHLKILDPACGSGAFLNQALEFLIREHTLIRDLLLPYEDLMIGYEIEKSILEHNLYGVDINEDAVEIAKLSLWLRTAHKGRELTSLNDKIVCANSLLAMPFEENSFDVVIGNPPYVRVQGLKSNYEDEAKLYERKFKSATGNYDIYALFLEMSFKMLKPTGKLSYILPHKFLIADFGSGLRTFLAENRAVESLLHFGSEMVFDEVSTYTCIVTLSHKNQKLNFKAISPKNIFDEVTYNSIAYEKLNADKWNLSNNNISKVLAKINQQPLKVKDVFSRIFTGIQTSADDIYLLLKSKDGLYSKSLDTIVEIEDGLLKPMLKGEDISRYKNISNHYFIIFPYSIKDSKAEPMSEEYIRDTFPKGYAYLKANEEFLRGREKGRFDNSKEWFLFSRKQGIDGVEQVKIITPDIAFNSQMSLDDGKYYHGTTLYSFIKKGAIQEDYRFYLTLLNSSLMWLFIQNTSTELRGGYFRFKTAYLEPFPLPKLENLAQQEPFIQKADLMLNFNKQLQISKQNFLNELRLEKIPQKLQKFEELEFDEFVKEYTKAKKVKFADKLEERNFRNDWSALFESDKKEVLELNAQLAKTDKEIDKMVYALYGLSEDEIGIVEEK